MRGYTLIEMVVVFVIVSLLALMMVPSYHSMRMRVQADAAICQLYRAVQLARTAAIRTNRLVTLCPTQTGESCAGDWSKGYMIFIDVMGQGQRQKDDPVIQRFSPVSKDDEITWKSFRVKNYVQMNSFGFTNFLNGTFLYCPKSHDAHDARALFMSKNGKLTFSQDIAHDGFHHDLDNQPLKCEP
jgi:type IV fimbrial biogenesis protein FimT